MGIAINPETPLQKITDLLHHTELVLILTVNPGGYGAGFVHSTIKKIKELRHLEPNKIIAVDGAMNYRRIKMLKKLGVNIFFVGSYIYKHPKYSIEKLGDFPEDKPLCGFSPEEYLK